MILLPEPTFPYHRFSLSQNLFCLPPLILAHYFHNTVVCNYLFICLLFSQLYCKSWGQGAWLSLTTVYQVPCQCLAHGRHLRSICWMNIATSIMALISSNNGLYVDLFPLLHCDFIIFKKCFLFWAPCMVHDMLGTHYVALLNQLLQSIWHSVPDA